MLCVQITQAAVRDSTNVREKNRTEMFQGSYYRVKTSRVTRVTLVL